MKTITLLLTLALTLPASAALIQFDIEGPAGEGLLPGNLPSPLYSGGTGGELAPLYPGLSPRAVFYNDVTNQLFLNAIGWGPVHGSTFDPLTSLVISSYLQGPDGQIMLSRTSNGVYGGSFLTTPVLTEAQEIQLLANQFFLEICTLQNPTGEMRGYLIAQVPDSGWSLGMALLGCIAVAVFGRMIPVRV